MRRKRPRPLLTRRARIEDWDANPPRLPSVPRARHGTQQNDVGEPVSSHHEKHRLADVIYHVAILTSVVESSALDTTKLLILARPACGMNRGSDASGGEELSLGCDHSNTFDLFKD